MADEELTRVLNELKGEDRRFWNPNRIYVRLTDTAAKGGEISISAQAIRNAFEGKDIYAYTSHLLRKEIERYAPGRLKDSLDQTDLDLGAFYKVSDREFRERGRSIEGHFQLYARSNVLPDYLWRGHAAFNLVEFDGRPRIISEIASYRPTIGTFDEKHYFSHGFASPCGVRSYFILLRSKYEKSDEMGATCVAERLNVNHENKVTKMMIYEIQYEPEKREYMNSKWLLLRREEDEICKDFAKIDTFENIDVLEDLCLMTKRGVRPKK